MKIVVTTHPQDAGTAMTAVTGPVGLEVANAVKAGIEQYQEILNITNNGTDTEVYDYDASAGALAPGSVVVASVASVKLAPPPPAQ